MARSVAEPMIHFFVDDSTDLDGLDEWDPDGEPTRFADGIGHNLLELHRRLAAVGRVTTVGPVVPRGTTLIVMMPRSFVGRPLREQYRYAWRLAPFRVVSIRSDLPSVVPAPVRTDVDVAPSRAFLEANRTDSMSFIPPLLQRGLQPRDPARGDLVSVIALKVNPENIPLAFSDPVVLAEIDRLGLRVVVDAPSRTDGSDQQWHDFRAVDVAICARREGQPTISKPATKLRNAWAAGVIPLASREPAYLEIATDRLDVLFFDDPSEVPRLLEELLLDTELRARLRHGVASAAASQPTVEDLVDEWWRLLVENESEPSWRRGVHARLFMSRRVARRVVGVVIRSARRFVSRAGRPD